MKKNKTEAKSSLTIIIPTFNRSRQVKSTLTSIANLVTRQNQEHLHVLLVDNNSSTGHRSCYIDLANSFAAQMSIEYLLESHQGRSHACNAGAAKAASDWIAFIDDDETISPTWLETALKLIQSHEFSYYGGHVLPEWEIPPPPWLPIHRGQYRGVLGWIELSEVSRSYDDFDAALCGGNMIVDRQLYLSVGGFSVALGRGAENLLGGEDNEFHQRLKRAQANGCYCPQLIVQHWIPVSRMTISYHRRWAYWSGVSNRIRIATQPDATGSLPYLLGIPRFWFSKGLQGLGQCIFQTITGRLKKAPDGVIGLLDFVYLVGLLRGKAEGGKLGLSMTPTVTHR